MITLCLEFSSERRSVAIWDLRGNVDSRPLADLREERPRERAAIAMIETSLRLAAIAPAQVECVVVGAGPGSYTGVRSAIALAQGWQLARGVKTLALPSLESIARQAWREQWLGKLSVLADAQRGDLYLATYEISAEGHTISSPLRLVASADLPKALAGPGRIAGPDASKLAPGGMDVFPNALDLGALALGRSDYLPAEKIEPIYLRETAFVKAALAGRS